MFRCLCLPQTPFGSVWLLSFVMCWMFTKLSNQYYVATYLIEQISQFWWSCGSSIFVVNQYVEGLPIRKCVCVNGFCWTWRGQENTWREKQKQIFDHSAQKSEKFETKKKSELAKKRTSSALQRSVKPVKYIENNITWRRGCNSAIFFSPLLPG